MTKKKQLLITASTNRAYRDKASIEIVRGIEILVLQEQFLNKEIAEIRARLVTAIGERKEISIKVNEMDSLLHKR